MPKAVIDRVYVVTCWVLLPSYKICPVFSQSGCFPFVQIIVGTVGAEIGVFINVVERFFVRRIGQFSFPLMDFVRQWMFVPPRSFRRIIRCLPPFRFHK